jgi:hypothetical protein
MQRHHNRRFRSYGWAEREHSVRVKLSEAGTPALAYKKRRAERKGVTQSQMILSSLTRDRLEMLIDEFLFAAGQTEGMLKVTERGTECLPPNSITLSPSRLRGRAHEEEDPRYGPNKVAHQELTDAMHLSDRSHRSPRRWRVRYESYFELFLLTVA